MIQRRNEIENTYGRKTTKDKAPDKGKYSRWLITLCCISCASHWISEVLADVSPGLYYTTAMTPLCYPEQSQYICKDQNWSAFFKGAKIRLVGGQGEWARIKARDQYDRTVWLNTNTVIPVNHVVKAAVMRDDLPLYDSHDLTKPSENQKVLKGDLVYVLERDKTSCRINIGDQRVSWTLCSGLSTDLPDVQASEMVAQLDNRKEISDWYGAVDLITHAKENSKFPFLTRLSQQLPELQKKLADLKAAEAQPDYQSCFGISLLDGNQE